MSGVFLSINLIWLCKMYLFMFDDKSFLLNGVEQSLKLRLDHEAPQITEPFS